MEEVEVKRNMPFEGEKVAEAVEEIMTQGPGAISRIVDQEVEPFIKDVETAFKSQVGASIYDENDINRRTNNDSNGKVSCYE